MGVGKKMPLIAKRSSGSYTAKCDVCDVLFWNHQLKEANDGLFYCYGPGTANDAKGMIAYDLDKMNADAAKDATVRGASPNIGKGRGI